MKIDYMNEFIYERILQKDFMKIIIKNLIRYEKNFDENKEQLGDYLDIKAENIMKCVLIQLQQSDVFQQLKNEVIQKIEKENINSFEFFHIKDFHAKNGKLISVTCKLMTKLAILIESALHDLV